MRSTVITCDINKPEIDRINSDLGCHYPVIYLDSSLHDLPDQLKTVLQGELDRMQDSDQVLLAMGFCGTSLAGIRAKWCRIVIPRVEDCLSLFLGSQRYRKRIMEEAPTYFLTKGWLNSSKNVLADYKRLHQRFGREKTQMVFDAMYGNYERLALIDTGLFQLEEQIFKTDRISKLLRLGMDIIPGSLNLITKLFIGPYDENFLILEPGSAMQYEDAFSLG